MVLVNAEDLGSTSEHVICAANKSIVWNVRVAGMGLLRFQLS